MKTRNLGLALFAVVVLVATQSHAQRSDMMKSHCEIIDDCTSCHVRTPVWEVDVIETAPLVEGFDCANCHVSDAGPSPQYLMAALTSLPAYVDSMSCGTGEINMTTHYIEATGTWTIKVETNITDLFHLAVWVPCTGGGSPCTPPKTCSGSSACGGVSDASKCGNFWCYSSSWSEPVFLVEGLDLSASTGPHLIKAYGMSGIRDPGDPCATTHNWTYHCCEISITGPPEPECVTTRVYVPPPPDPREHYEEPQVVSQGGYWKTVITCPPMTLTPDYLPADGASEAVALLTGITDSNGNGITSGYLTVETTIDSIVTADAHAGFPGIQVPITDDGTGKGQVTFNVRAGTTGGQGNVTAKNLSGAQLATKQLTVIHVDIAAFERVAPGVEQSVVVTTTPSPLVSGVSVSLSIARTSGNDGAATITDPTSATITQTETIKVRGDQQSWGSGSTAAPDNMELRATFSGASAPFDTEAFTVCAHAENFTQTAGYPAAGGVLHFEYVWSSDSGNLSDLDRVWVGEHVTYSDGGVHVGTGRPWLSNNPDPTILPSRTTMSGTAGGGQDNHSSPGATAGPADSYTATQHYGYRCLRHDPGPVDNTLGWQQNLLGPITISRFVELVGTNWQYRIEKSGVVNTLPLP